MFSESKHVAAPGNRILWLLATVCLCASLPLQSMAQTAAPPGFESYSLEHAQLDSTSDQLQKLLDDSQLPAEILLDRQQNRLLVRGSQAAQKLAAQLIMTLDKPGAKVATPAQADPVLQGYPVEASELQAAKNQLEATYPPRSGVRVSADPRTNQLLVLAPPAVQQQIAAQFPAEPSGRKPVPLRREFNRSQEAPQNQSAPAAAAVAIPHKLKHLTWNELEDGLNAILADRASMTSTPDGKVSHWQIQMAPDRQINLNLDRTQGEVTFRGAPADAMAARRLITAMDQPRSVGTQQTRILPVQPAAATASQEAAKVVRWASQFNDSPAPTAGQQPAAAKGNNRPQVERRMRWGGDLAARLFQQPAGAGAEANQPAQANGPAGNQPNQPPANQADANQADATVVDAPPGLQDEGGLIGSVQIEFVEGLDVIILRGNKRDVDRVAGLIAEIERLTAATEPVIEVYTVEHVGSEQMAEVVSQVYDQVLAPRTGPVSIVPLVKPNAILLVGRDDSVAAVKKFIEKLDQPTPPAAEFAVIRLQHMAAQSAQTIVTEYLSTQQAGGAPGAGGQAAGAVRQNLGTRAKVVADYRTNSIIVFAGPRDLLEVEKLIERLDVVEIEATNEVKVFKLKNSVAEELAPVLQEAILGSGGAAAGGAAQLTPGGANTDTQRSRQLIIDMMMIDAAGGKELKSGVLADVSISADARSNALIVTAPAESMPLIAALIEELDKLPTPEALVKVFTIANGDATQLADTLREMFGITQSAGGGGGFGGAGGGTGSIAQQTATGAGDSSLVNMKFGVDNRTNSIIASGTAGDLEVVEAILLRLDDVTSRGRETTVYQLNNAPAQSVADAISQLLIDQRTIVQQTEQQSSLVPPLTLVARQVIVVPEPISNSLLISATPQYFQQVLDVVRDLDRRPPMVRIDVLIAEVMLDDFNEVGFELGLQDSLLFDRGIGAQTGGTNPVGFPFNNLPLGNNTGVNPTAVGTQGLSSFGLGRMSPTAGFGGLVFSASSESVNILVRALHERGKLQVLSRPQITTMDNIPGSVLVGQIVSRIRGTTINASTTTQDIEDINVGLLLDVTPRVAPDGLVTMAVNVQKSALDDDGVPIPTGNGGVVISPNINTTDAETTVSARSGQTIVFSGLITKSKMNNTRGIPVLSDLPYVGPFFRFDTEADMRSELLIILTPTIVQDDQDVEWLKRTESERMNWCLADVIELYGDKGLVGINQGIWNHRETPVIFPHENPGLDGWEGPVEEAPGELTLPPGGSVSEDEVPPEVRQARNAATSHRKSGEDRSILVPTQAQPPAEQQPEETSAEGPTLAPARGQVQPAGYYPPWTGE